MRASVMSKTFITIIAVMSVSELTECASDVQTERAKLLAREAEMSLGSKLNLTKNEEIANEIIMKYKLQEVEDGFRDPEKFKFSRHYFSYKNDIEKSKLYNIIKKMPKGGTLHVHDAALLGPDYLLNITYMDHLYINFQGDTINFVFSDKAPKNGRWQLVNKAREASGNPKKFDMEIKKHFTIVIDDPLNIDTDINAVWKRFYRVFNTIFPMLTYKPVWERYFYDALKAFREDGIMYTEVRTTLPPLYELDGEICEYAETARAYKRATDKFLLDHPDFVGAKIIYAPMRLVDSETIENYLIIAKKLKTEFGDFIAGFDLVGQEDLGRPLKDFLPLLESAKGDIDFFFHAGETNWWGTSSDENLVDAVLLGTRRIGHGYALLKHPVVTQIVRERNIGIEVNVISNQVLRLVQDLRNHPLAEFLALDLPVVISSDDPGLWEAPPVSHDFYVVIAGIANKHAGIRTLKQLAVNSLKFSALKETEKAEALRKFEEKWSAFVNDLIESEK